MIFLFVALTACSDGGDNGISPSDGDESVSDGDQDADNADTDDDGEESGEDAEGDPEPEVELGPPCETYADCPEEEVCRDGHCATPVVPTLNPDALRRPSNDDADENMLVNGRLLRRAAPSILLGTFATNMEFSPDGTLLAINENGFGTVQNPDNWTNKKHMLRFVDAASLQIKQEIAMPRGSMYVGLRWNQTGGRLYVVGGEDERVHIFERQGDEFALARSISVDGCYTTDISFDPDETTLYVTCDLQGATVAVNLADGEQLWRLSAGRTAYMTALTPDGKRLFVANWATVNRPDDGDTIAVFDLEAGQSLGAIAVGLAPEGLVFSPDGSKLYAVCNKSDDVFEIDVQSLEVRRRLSLHADPEALKGIQPIFAAISPDGKTLYVTGAGENLVAVLDLDAGEVTGLIPTEWYPTDIALSPDGETLYVLNGKGRGDGPTEYLGEGPESSREDHDAVGRQIFSTLFKMPVPDANALTEMTATVVANNERQSGYFDFSLGNDTPLPSPGETRESPVKYVFLILKENFAYDSAYGDLGVGDGEPSYALWGEDVIPNQRKLARAFTLFDNFFCDSESSIDGHQWAAASIEPDWVEKTWVLGYAGFGFSDPVVSVTAGTIPESQFFLPHLIQQGISVYGYGGIENFGAEAFTTYRDSYMADYPWNLGQEWLDRDRGAMFKAEFEKRLADGAMPAMSWVFFPNNHAFGLRVGQLTPEHWVADNDEGVGIAIDTIANSPIWEQSVIFIFEDDSQHGFDHIDKHRCPALAIGPYVKRQYVSSVAYSMPNIHKTIELLLGSKPMNRFDNLASGMYDIFRLRPDTTPYAMEPRRYPEKIYEGPENALTRLSSTLDWDDIDKNPEAAELYWRYIKGTEPPVRVDAPRRGRKIERGESEP